MTSPIRALFLCLFAAVPAAAVGIDERFENPRDNWQLQRHASPDESFNWPKESEPSGLRFVSRGLDTLTTSVDLHGAFEVVAEIELTSGHAAAWRNNGIVIAFSSAPIPQMAKSDWALMFAAVQQGMTATLTRGGARWGHEIRPDVWNYHGAGAAPRYVLSMAGGGGHDYSAKWPVSNCAGTRLRFHAVRTADHLVRFTVYHADGDAAPWWRGEAKLPPDLQNVPLKWITLHTGREAAAFAKPQTQVPSTAQLAGIVHRVAARTLQDGRDKWNQPFPAATLPAKPQPANHKPMLIANGDIAALRTKFNNPALASYRAVLLRNASDRRATKQYNSPAQGEYLTALTWAYMLTQDKSYLDKCITEIDALITSTEKTPAEPAASPGHLLQILDIAEFMGHNIADLATAYDLLGQFFLIDPGYFDHKPTDHTLPLIGPIESAKLDARAVCPISDAWESNSIRTITVDATAAHGSTAKKVRRVLVMLADTAAIALDDIEPAAADAPVTAQYQAGFATKTQGDSFIVTSPTASLVVSTFGPKLKFESTPRTFKRDNWAFATRPNVAWNSVRAPYTPDPARPLITVMTPQTPDKPAPSPTVNFAENQIDIQIASQSVSFTRSTGKWQPIKS